MFEALELGRKIAKEDYKAQLPALRADLLQAQFALSKTNRPVIILISGTDGAGRGDVVNVLNEWLDPRLMKTVSFERITEDNRERPKFWKYWQKMPARGHIGVFFGAWYVDPIRDYAYKNIDQAKMDELMSQARRFESMLVHDDAIIIKFWMHLSYKEQVSRLKKMEKDPNTMRRVSKRDWKHVELHKEFSHAAERTIRHTDTGEAPWNLIDATDKRYRNLEIGRTVLSVLRKHLDADATLAAAKEAEALITESVTEDAGTTGSELPEDARRTVLDTVDLSQSLDKKEYRKQLETWQGNFNRLSWAANKAKISSVFVFEGSDAGGKGGAIRRMTQATDARLAQVISTAAPTDEERAHHYLWRFWRHVPLDGTITIYDRSWYGRVLVERVEGFATEEEWARAYLEINNFEEMLVEHGTLVMKFWLHISKEEQLYRFKEREKVPYKQHKITDEDWRNREKWDDYALAVNDMVARTSTNYAPWFLIPGNNKYYARIKVLKSVCKQLEKRLDGEI
ncbi:polyphosphate:AMP phosphotransferase [Candidatus Venteria ishoeyi]|uniref:Thymidylate kinase n=1 Tax=Candidatus Venteria ishoeyi TaxID=1899563 RepID=A0A1H6F4P9_9GAMM|nr:polyphosphate:AMP phosphotransferase [Candidatus Venteria ishoeyi]MDM8547236.1 polyphosphate:AMP phosphotransferase [Candidatus Venteria ishoeyi]SEH05110.1 Thymidylate kinase [Candidatus Venteria ishoeyi]